MSNVCPNCDAKVYEDLPGGMCPTCLMAAARKLTNEADETAAMPISLQAPTIEEMRKLFPEMEVVELIGQGGMGAVYKAIERNLERTVALKVFLYRNEDPSFAERFKREARALAKLKHNNIVGVHHIGERADLHFMIMEYVDGLNLRQLSTDQRLEPAQAMQLVPKLCDALQYAHDNGVIHRDIKPENILIDSSGEIKIADFGLAKMTGSGKRGTLTHTRQVMGTWNYMAPEQVERPTEVDHRADIYSLGVVIYEMLTGELPLGRFQPPSEKVGVNTRLDNIVLRALEKEPERRYQQANDFKSGVESVGDYAADYVANTAVANAAVASGAIAGGGAVERTVAPPQPAPPIKAANYAASAEGSQHGPRYHITVMGGKEKKGRWTVGVPNNVFTLMGGTTLDLTQVAATDVVVNSFVMMGGVEIIVPTGSNVDVDGMILMGATDNNVKSLPGRPPMNVRVRSYGMMGGCEIVSKSRKPSEAVKVKASPNQSSSTFSNGLVAAYSGVASTVAIAIPLVFIMGAMDVIEPHNTVNWLGIMTALFAGLLWSGLAYVRILAGVRPEDATDQELEDHDSASIIGTLIRCLALVVAFAVPALFVTAAIGPEHYFPEGLDEDRLRMAAIGCIFGSVILVIAARTVEDVFFGRRNF